MAPILVALHDELRGKAIIRFVDVWKYRDLAEDIPLQVIPTQIFFDADGKPLRPQTRLKFRSLCTATKKRTSLCLLRMKADFRKRNYRGFLI